MSEALHPHESASIDEGLRTRLEGTVELLEDALPLLDSLMYLVSRAESSTDDMETLREYVTQLPQLEEAIQKASRHEETKELTNAVATRTQRALLAANQRLVTLGRNEVTSLRSAVSAILELLRQEGRAPQPAEMQLMASPGLQWRGALFLAIWFTICFVAVGLIGDWRPWGLLPPGAALCLFVLLNPGRSPWVLLPDRLFLPARWPRMPRQVDAGKIRRVRFGEGLDDLGVVRVELANETLHLQSDAAPRLATWLRVLRSKWLVGLRSPSVFIVTEARDQADQQREERALLTPEGILFISRDRRGELVRALTTEKLPTELTLEELLSLLGHLPEGRWKVIAEHLELSAHAQWIPRGELQRDGSLVRSGDRSWRLLLSGHPRRADAEALLQRLVT